MSKQEIIKELLQIELIADDLTRSKIQTLRLKLEESNHKNQSRKRRNLKKERIERIRQWYLKHT